MGAGGKGIVSVPRGATRLFRRRQREFPFVVLGPQKQLPVGASTHSSNRSINQSINQTDIQTDRQTDRQNHELSAVRIVPLCESQASRPARPLPAEDHHSECFVRPASTRQTRTAHNSQDSLSLCRRSCRKEFRISHLGSSRIPWISPPTNPYPYE